MQIKKNIKKQTEIFRKMGKTSCLLKALIFNQSLFFHYIINDITFSFFWTTTLSMKLSFVFRGGFIRKCFLSFFVHFSFVISQMFKKSSFRSTKFHKPAQIYSTFVIFMVIYVMVPTLTLRCKAVKKALFYQTSTF